MIIKLLKTTNLVENADTDSEAQQMNWIQMK